MTHKKKSAQKGGAGKVAAKIVASILALALVAGIAFGVVWLLRREKEPDGLSVEIGGTVYTTDQDGLFLYPGTEIKVRQKSGASDYTVKIAATAEWKDFNYTVGAEPYKWSNMDGVDFTERFKIKKTADGFTVDYESIQAVIAGYYAQTVTLPEGQDLTGNLFKMTISTPKGSLNFAFGLGLAVTGIGLNQTEIVF